ncbi:MAG TPA: acyl-CoA dehydrogenase family protein [Gemmatimonadales bacterium]|nr:acyl-CoA dehydrogenase family protein [Gemmatimonadales bacterium]
MSHAALFSGGAEAFRLEVCRFLTEELAPARVAGHTDARDRTGLDAGFERALQREAGRRGYLGVSVDAVHGGGGQPPEYAAAFQYEAAYHDAPLIDTALVLAGAPVMAFGTEVQRAELLPRMLAGDIEMCIAYTEPGAGNDLSGIATTAAATGGAFALRGTKTLITGADKADACLTIAVTDAGADLRGRFSMFLVDMHAPGVAIVARPTMARYALWDVVFDDAPAELLGTVGEGWRQLASAVEGERNAMFGLGWCQRLFDELVRFSVGEGVVDDAWAADAIGGLWADLQAGRRLALAALSSAGRPRRVLASAAKVHLTELAQRLASTGTGVSGAAGGIEGSLFGRGGPERFCYEALFRVDGPISVGANELHRDAIAQLGLGAPR